MVLGEVALFGQDWLTFRNSFIEGISLYITAKVQPKKWKADEYEVSLKTVQLMSEVKDSVINKVTLTMPIGCITNAMVDDLAEITHECPGKAQLYFNIVSNESTKSLLFARKSQISVQKKLMNYISEHPEIDIKIN